MHALLYQIIIDTSFLICSKRGVAKESLNIELAEICLMEVSN